MRNKLLIFCFCIAGVVNAQQVPFYSNIFYKPFVLNPAFAGNKTNTEITLVHRSQFTGFQNAPNFTCALADGTLKTNTAYLAGGLSQHNRGFNSTTNAFGAYAYQVNFSDEVNLRFGLSLGFAKNTYDFSQIQVQNYNDPNLFTNSVRANNITSNAGLGFTAQGLKIGIAIPQVIGGKVKFYDNQTARSFYQESRHFLFSLQYDLKLNEEKGISLAPVGLVRMVKNAPLQYDAGILFNWDEKMWFSAVYRAGYAVSANAGFTLNRRFSVGYSYDYAIGPIKKYAGINQEILLSVKLGKLKPLPGEDTLTPQDRKIIDLQKQIDELKKNGVKAAVKTDTKAEGGTVKYESKFNPSGKNVKQENGIYILTNHSKDYTYLSGTLVPKGFYVVAGSYYYKDYAEQEVARFHSFGFPDAEVMIDKLSKFNYVFLYHVETKEEALKKVKEAKDAGVPEVWIQILVE